MEALDQKKDSTSWYFVWGRVGIWKKPEWAFEVYYPYIRYNRLYNEIFGELDTVLRINFSEPSFGFRILGFGFGISFDLSRLMRGSSD